MKKITIIGPINSRGGREIETAFVATTLQQNYEVSIYSTETVNDQNDLFLVNPSLVIYNKHKSFFSKIFAAFGFKATYKKLLFKKLKGSKTKSLHDVIANTDLVFIMAQLTSNYTKEIIDLSEKLNKKVIFRTTGTIPNINLKDAYFSYLKQVDIFINHSENNSNVFKEVKDLNYKIIDQCVFKEDNLKVNQKTEINKIQKFYCASRLDNNKDVLTVIKAFNLLKENTNLELHIIGEGSILEDLKSQVKNSNITFYGHLEYDNMITTISNFDCLIISSIEEAGPYSALEAMLLGIPILSTKVGAMQERFKNDESMWFASGDYEVLSNKILEYSNYSPEKIKLIQKRYIEIYNNNHSKKTIAKAYLDTVDLYLK